MTSQVFYRKWRPQTLAEVVGQNPVTQTLLNALSSGRISHAYLFCGPRGTGKTSTGRIFAKAVNCLNNGKGEPCNECEVCQAITNDRSMDVIEIDAASNRGIDDIRELRERVNYSPGQSRYKVYIIDEVHMLTQPASNALLKTLEEPPAHIIFILATTESHKILPTITSRCQRFDFRRLSQKDVVSKLSHICEKESISIEYEALRLIARSSTGSLRDAENLLEQLYTYYETDITLKQVQDILGITGDWRARELVKNIINNDIAAGMETISSVNNDGLDLRQFNRELIEYLRELLLIKSGAGDTVDVTAEDITELKALAEKAALPQILNAVKLFGQVEIGFDNYSTLPLELALVDCILETETRPESTKQQDVQKPSPPEAFQTPKPRKKAETPQEIIKPEATVEPPTPPENQADDQADDKEPVTEDKVTEEPVVENAEVPVPLSANGAEISPDIENMQQNWKQVIEQAPPSTRRTAAIAVLRSAGVTPVAIENDTVVLSFRYKYHKEQIEKTENLHIAEEIISSYLGRPCHIHCVQEDNHLLKAALKMGAKIIDTEEK